MMLDSSPEAKSGGSIDGRVGSPPHSSHERNFYKGQTRCVVMVTAYVKRVKGVRKLIWLALTFALCSGYR